MVSIVDLITIKNIRKTELKKTLRRENSFKTNGQSFYADTENENSSEKDDLILEPAAEDMDNKGKFPSGASMPVTDLYRRKHKTDSKSNEA